MFPSTFPLYRILSTRLATIFLLHRIKANKDANEYIKGDLAKKRVEDESLRDFRGAKRTKEVKK